jgi:Extensin-like protein C-terminus
MRRPGNAPLALGFAACAVVAHASHAQALDPVEPPDAAHAPAVRYASLDRASCEAELRKRAIPFARVDAAKGVLAPVRLAGPIRGVAYRTELPAAQRPTSPYEIFDCRLVLALDDFSQILAKHDVVGVVHYSAYRPPGLKWPTGKVGTRHGGGLAIDVGKLVKKDGSLLHIEKDFHGRIGATTCGPNTGPDPATPEAVELRTIVCEATGARLFNVALTPDYNWEHRNHFHLEVTANAKWFLVH